MQTRNTQSGFTLIEVMVVVVILGILAAVIVPKIMDKPDEARIVKVKADIQAIQSSLEVYRLDNYVYPSTDEGLQALVQKPASSS
ncbi:MAG TPA: type II secretion system major pseudopilin GspG, partial [Gammaproteobacteria bacterium]